MTGHPDDEPPLGWLILGKNVKVRPRYKYARIERERRFLLDHFPSLASESGRPRVTGAGTVLRGGNMTGVDRGLRK